MFARGIDCDAATDFISMFEIRAGRLKRLVRLTRKINGADRGRKQIRLQYAGIGAPYGFDRSLKNDDDHGSCLFSEAAQLALLDSRMSFDG